MVPVGVAIAKIVLGEPVKGADVHELSPLFPGGLGLVGSTRPFSSCSIASDCIVIPVRWIAQGIL